MRLFVLNIIMANGVKKCSEIKFHTERPIKLSAIPCKKEKRTAEVFSPGNYALLCLVLFRDLTLGVGAYGVKIKSLTRQNDKGFSITPRPLHPLPPYPGNWTVVYFRRGPKFYTLCTKYSYSSSNNLLTCHR